MTKNIVFMTCMEKAPDILDYKEWCFKSWKLWCKKNDVEMVVLDQELRDRAVMKPTWQRWHVFDVLKENNVDYNQVALVDVDTMIPLGLVMNELVSNALKHAFKNQKVGKINVDLKRSEDCLTLKVSDNGQGLNDINELDGQSFGYELIKAFARKLKADIKIESQEGLSIELKIKNYTTAA